MKKISTVNIEKLLAAAIEYRASDLHLMVGVAPVLRIDGRLMVIPDQPVLESNDTKNLIYGIMNDQQSKIFEEKKETDFSFGYQSTRFRANVYHQKGELQASLRLISSEVPSFESLGLPPILERFTNYSQGFVIISGPTGHGKSTTLAALIESINKNRSEHIITIEDPIEYVFKHRKSIVSQREVGSDTLSFAQALKSSLREDPNILLVGEMRDLETIEAALTLAETGHLVFTTLHTNSAAQTADRIIDVFPPHQQQQVRAQLANVLLGVVSQRLIPRTSGGRIAACEIMIANNAIKNLIRDGKSHQIPGVIQTSSADGMIELDKVLAELVSKGEITLDDALMWSIDPKELKMKIY
jgi:twitching motility protein PilT